MPYDVFISHSSLDKPIADAVCATLEANGIRCWIAPRDILAGQDWPARIIEAIEECTILVLVFSSHANKSDDVQREIHHAFGRGMTVIPFRVERVEPEQSLRYFIRNVHWLDAITPPMEQHLQQLADTAKSILASIARTNAGSEATTPTPVPLPADGRKEAMSVAARAGIVAVLCTLGLIGCIGTLLKTMAPPPGSPEATVFAFFPLVQTANLFANIVNAPLNALILAGCWMVFRGKPEAAKLIRGGAIAIGVVTAVWALLVLLAGVTAPAWSGMSGGDRATFVTNTFVTVLVPLAFLGAIWFLFRRRS